MSEARPVERHRQKLLYYRYPRNGQKMAKCKQTPGDALSDAGIRAMPPGVFLTEHLLHAEGMSVSAAAEMTGLSAEVLFAIVDQQATVTPAIASKLSRLPGGFSKTYWLNLQAACDSARTAAAARSPQEARMAATPTRSA